MSKVLIIAEHDQGQLSPATAKTVTAALNLSPTQLDVVVFGDAGASEVAEQASSLSGIHTVRLVTDTSFSQPMAADIAPEVVSLAPAYTHVFVPSTTFGRDLMPRVAGLMRVNQISDVMAVLGDRSFKRPIYAGNAIVTVKVPEAVPVILATVRTASFAACAMDGSGHVEAAAPMAARVSHTRFVRREGAQGDGPDLSSASVVVSGGRALGSGENFGIIYSLAKKLGAAVGASRAAVDAGYVPNELQVGQTGKIIAPDLYIAVGISGAIQHLTGIKDAGTIVAINKDGEAPIFEVADLGLVGDLFELVPELERSI